MPSKHCVAPSSSDEVSPAATDLDSVLQSRRERPLGVTPFIQLDGMWCKCGHGGLVQVASVPVAGGIQEDGKRALSLVFPLRYENMKFNGTAAP